MANEAEATPPAIGLTHSELEVGNIGMHEAHPARLPACP